MKIFKVAFSPLSKDDRFSLLALHICREYLDEEGMLCVSDSHAWVSFEGVPYEPQTGERVEPGSSGYRLKRSYPAERALELCRER